MSAADDYHDLYVVQFLSTQPLLTCQSYQRCQRLLVPGIV